VPSLTIDAFAKINLTLSVLGARADGLHEVRTVLQTIDLSDRLTFALRPGPFVLRCGARGVPTDRSNLVWRAAEALWRAAGRSGDPRDLLVTLDKRIPARAGLGGGSSDAAATLVALDRLWRLGLSREALTPVAAALGADVPFFLWGGAALGLGRGDDVYPLPDLPAWWALVVVPPFGVLTADAYGWLDRQAVTAGPAPARDRRLARTWLARLPAAGNDLEGPVSRHHPEIAATVARLRGQGALLSAMSGSGSALFGLFSTRAAADAARLRLRPGAGWRRHVARLLPRATCERRARPRGWR
jgi:4-diphosphocytidyl-2-C-methyl-D-erythritol kinase